ncbi:MAG: phosphopantetheine-binding protein [Sulfobacillus sp.]
MDQLLQLLRNDMRIEVPLQSDTPLLSSGLITSLRLGTLIVKLERTFSVKLNVQDVGTDNFDTPEQIWAYIGSSR